MKPLPLPRSVFGQLALVIGLTLLGASLLALTLGRELATRPAPQQLLQSIDSFADLAEELAHTQSPELAAWRLREAGLDVRAAPPELRPLRIAPFMRELQQQATQRLDAGRELRVGRGDGDSRVWLKLDTQPTLWVSFAFQRRGERALRYSLLMLLGSVVLVWGAAAYYARRLVVPLRQLAQAAPTLVRGEPQELLPASGPREVSELRDTLMQAGRDVRAAAEERAFLLAGISHDLRTPLMRLQLALELMPGSDAELRAGIDRDIAEIDAILGQFIDYARDGRDEASETVDLAAICRHALDAAGGDWQARLPDVAPLTGKPMALLRAVENLLVNAQRHGAPPFALTLSRCDDAWCLQVDDHGPGLPMDAEERLRQPFVRGGNGGHGLGLAIVDRVARQHGGELRLLPRTPRGLCAVLRLRGA